MLTIRANNVVLIVEDEITLVDTGLRGSSPQIIDFINQLGRSPEEISLIILTHNHPDHVGGLAELKRITRARVAIHRADTGTLKVSGTRGSAAWKSPLRLVLSALHLSFSSGLGDADIKLSGGEILKPLGGMEVIHTPGHTPGSISLYSPSRKFIIVGDAVRNRKKALYLPPRMASTDLSQATESLKKIAGFDFNTLCSGHGRPLLEDAQADVQALVDTL